METPSAPTLRPLELVKSPTAPSQIESIGPFCVYVFWLLLADFLGFVVMRATHVEDAFPVALLASLILGQVALAIIVGGLMGDNWLEGLFASIVLVMCGLGMVTGGEINLFYPVVLPLACFIAALPLILLRWTIGWRLRRQELPNMPRTRLTIEDMILVPASVVAICVMAFASSIQDSEPSFLMEMATSLLPLPFGCLLFILPCTYWAFRVEDSVMRWLLCLGFPLVLVIVFVMPAIALFSRGLPFEAVGWSVFCALVASGIAMLGLQILYSGGYRLTNSSLAVAQLQALPASVDPPSVRCEPSPFDIEESTSSHKTLDDSLTVTSRRRHRIAVAILLVVTVSVNTGTWAYSQVQLRRSLKRITANGGTVEMAGGKPIRITFGPTTTDDVFDELPSMGSVKFISLARTNATHLYLGNKFRSLESIDIRETSIDPQQIYGGHQSIELLVGEGQFSDSEVKNLAVQRFSVKEIAE